MSGRELTSYSKYLACDGGPHLLLPFSARGDWKGCTDESDPLNPDTDYGRACLVEPPIGLVNVGAQKALVLAGNPLLTTWRGSPREGRLDLYVLEAWDEIDLDLLVDSAASATQNTTDSGLRWVLKDGGISLMFAGEAPGKTNTVSDNTVYGEIPIPVSPGTYKISTGSFDGEHGRLWIARLERETG